MTPKVNDLQFKFNMRGNKKTGPIPVTTTDQRSCPTSCEFYGGNGCYAETGPQSWSWLNMLKAGDRAAKSNIDFDLLVELIRRLPKGQLWRHNVAGDLVGIDHDIDEQSLNRMVIANRGKKGFTFTHKFKDLQGNIIPENIRKIRDANQSGFTINLSASDYSQADRLKSLGLPIAVTQPSDMTLKSYLTPANNLVVTCPAARDKKKHNCANCGLCFKKDRSFFIGFPAHGARKRKVNLISTVTIEEKELAA